MRVVGIDPDLSGALAILDFDKMVGEAHHLPTKGVYFKTKKTTRKRLDDGPLAELFLELMSNPAIRPSHIFIEQALALNKDAPAAMLTNGITTGKILMGATMAALVHDLEDKVNIVVVPPGEWKAGFGLIFPDLPYKEKKKKAVAFATDLFPGLCHQWPKVGNTSLAEATLIALYGAMTHGVVLPKVKHPSHLLKTPLNPMIQSLT